MKLTNKHNIPQVFVNAIERDDYTKGNAHLSVTELINSPRIVQLKRMHWEEIEEDVSDKIFALLGKAVHYILEHGKEDGSIREQRLFAELDGWSISGAIDLQETDDGFIDISDHKLTGSWSVMNDKVEWEQQLNMYAWMVEKVKNIPVRSIRINAIVRDWSKREASYKDTYPQAPIVVLDIPLWRFEEREQFIHQRIHSHSQALFQAETNAELPPCTPLEMWEKPTSYAVRKSGNKRATSVHSTKEEAEANLEVLGKGYELEVRPGERTRCESYCQVRDFCSQYQQWRNE